MRRIFTIAVLLFVAVLANGQAAYSRYDVNRDGKVDMQDVNLLQSKLLSTCEPADVEACDVNVDGRVSITDLTWLIDRLLLRRPDSYIGCGIRIMTEEAERLGPTSVRLRGTVLGLDNVDALYSVYFLYSQTNPDPRINGADVKRVTAEEDRKDMSGDVLEGLMLGGTYYCRLVFVATEMNGQVEYYGPVRPFKTDDPVTPGAAVDMGYGITLAGWNLGASSPEGLGSNMSWNEAKELELADGWRLPTKEEVEFMHQKFSWTPIVYRGVDGYLVKSINGNAVFFPKEHYWTSSLTDTGYACYYDTSIKGTTDTQKFRLRALKKVEGDRSGMDADGHAYVDLGLSVCWATCNVGGESPEDYGDQYGWGETSGYYDGHTQYNWSVYQHHNPGTSNWTSINKYQVDDNQKTGCWYAGGTFKGDGKKELEAEDDVASVKWGGAWTMPTFEQMNELLDMCHWKWDNICRGYNVIGPNGNSIFLPAAGCRYSGSLGAARVGGYYWTRSLCPYNTSLAYVIEFDYDNVYDGYLDRYCGQSVRAVHP